jgi:hypothetical protein
MFRFAVVCLISAVFLVACGGSDSTPSTTAGSTTTTGAGTTAPPVDTTAPTTPTGGGAGGQVVVAGEALAVDQLLRCVPFGDSEADLDLTVLGAGYQLFIYISRPLGDESLVTHELTIQGSAAGGVFAASANSFGGGGWTMDDGEQALSGPPFEYSGDSVSGSMLLTEIYEGETTVEVSFNVPVPTEIVDCSL